MDSTFRGALSIICRENATLAFLTAPSAPAVRTVRRPRHRSDAARLLLLICLQAIVAAMMSASPGLATVHALATGGAVLAAARSRRPEVMMMASGYVVGVENIWRVTGAAVPYMYPNYLLLFLLAVLIGGTGKLRLPVLPMLLLGVLLPSAALTVVDLGLGEARERITFTLMPLLVLVSGVICFGRYQIAEGLRRRVIASIVIPTVGLAVVVLIRMLAAGEIVFGTSSNFATSGGFGPNRIAASLGFGALLCFLEAIRERQPRLVAVYVCLGVWLATQSSLTFSRGGVLSAMIALGVGLMYQAIRRGHLFQALLVVGAVGVLAIYVVLPRLDTLTDGALNTRFSDLETERTSLAEEDLSFFLDHPFVGIGAGETAFMRESGVRAPAHTEYTRLLAEHGMFGVAAIIVLAVIAGRSVRRTPPGYRSYCLALLVWAFAQMGYANLRISAVAFAFAFAGLRPASGETSGTPATSR